MSQPDLSSEASSPQHSGASPLKPFEGGCRTQMLVGNDGKKQLQFYAPRGWFADHFHCAGYNTTIIKGPQIKTNFENLVPGVRLTDVGVQKVKQSAQDTFSKIKSKNSKWSE